MNSIAGVPGCHRSHTFCRPGQCPDFFIKEQSTSLTYKNTDLMLTFTFTCKYSEKRLTIKVSFYLC